MRILRRSRSPLVFWAAAAGLALLTALVVSSALARARALESFYGPLRPVVVAARAVERGTPLADADLEVTRLPARWLPPGSIGSLATARSRSPVVPLLPGQPVLRGHLAPDGLVGAAALLPPGTRAVSVPVGGASAPVRVGDVVDVLATLDGHPTVALALDAPVVAAGDDSASVAVSPEEARAVAFAVAHGSLTLALAPGAAPAPAQRTRLATSPSTAAPATTR